MSSRFRQKERRRDGFRVEPMNARCGMCQEKNVFLDTFGSIYEYNFPNPKRIASMKGATSHGSEQKA